MAGFDLDAYLARIDRPRPAAVTAEAVAALLRAHMSAIPFENLDVLLGRGVRVDLEGVFDKLVLGRRGGYCFEHGTLFQGALAALGVEAVAHAARVVRVVPRPVAPRTHMLLTVALEGQTWVLDPGFGGHGPRVPLPLDEGREVAAGPDVHRLARRDGEWVLEGRIGGVMVPLWSSSLEPQYPVDFVLANHYVSTFPESPFVTRLLLQAHTPRGRIAVMNRDVTVLRDGVEEKRQLADRRELRGLIAEHFGFDLPEAESLRVPSVPQWT